MEHFMACRICLNTDIKLYNMDHYRLKYSYQELCGNNDSQLDSMLHHICSYCAALLHKFSTFKEKCEQAKHLMEFLFAEDQLTTEHVRKINTVQGNIAHPYTAQSIFNYDLTGTNIKEEIEDNIDNKTNSKCNFDNIQNRNNVYNNFDNKIVDNSNVKDSDDEPLSIKAKDTSRKIRKKKDKIQSYSPKSEIVESPIDSNEEMVAKWHCGNMEMFWDNNKDSFTEWDSNKVILNDGNTADAVLNEDGNTGDTVLNEDGNTGDTILKEESNSANSIMNEEDSIINILGKKDDSDMNWENNEFAIEFLTVEQQIEEVLARKQSSNYLNSQYKCEYCFKGYMTEVTFKNHMIRHDKCMGRHVCAACGARWRTRSALRAHVQAAHARRYTCTLCAHTDKSHHKAKEHMQWHKGYMFVCKLCGATFQKSTTYLTHVRLRHPAPEACDLCGDCFVSETGLRMHKKKVHRNIDSGIEYLECITCGSKFRNEDALKRHRDLAVNDVCDMELRPCDQCGAGFPSEESLKEHLQHHKVTLRRTCTECTRSFANERTLAMHVSRAHGAPRGAGGRRAQPCTAVCEVCGLTCLSKTSLMNHQRMHTGEKPYKCTVCNKTFSVQQRLQIHIRTHTGERPFSCEVCPKAFKHKAALNRHNRVHTGVRPYRCTTCGKTFTQSNSMKQHASSVHLKAPLYARRRRGDERALHAEAKAGIASND